MEGGETAAVTAGHGLDEVERLAAAQLADDDAVRTHAERDPEERADRDLAASLGVGRAAFEGDDVIAEERELLRVLDDHDAFVVGDELRDRVEQRRLAARGAARDDDVLLGLDEDLDHLGGVRGDRVELEEALHRQLFPEEPADRDVRAAVAGGRQHGGDARSVRQSALEQRALVVDVLADVLRGVAQRRVERLHVRKDLVDLLQLALALDVDLARAVDHDLGDRRIVEVATNRVEEAEERRVEDDLGNH